MKVPINQKFMLTITEASEYFGMGEKVLRKLENLPPVEHLVRLSLSIGSGGC